MVTQAEVLAELEDEGYQVNKRTLGYWRERGLLPPLERDGQQYYWEEEVVDRVKDLCSKREGGVLSVLNLEGNLFQVERIEIKSLRGVPTAIIYFVDGNFILKKLREGLLNAISSI
tara:strand:- start:3968 stop:4315 length:348 start_codon:yes stop_codon:yes gene_type:complete